MQKVLITGIAGGQGRLLTHRLLGRSAVCGVDVEPWRGHPLGVSMHSVDLRGRRFEDVVRTEKPSAVVHLGFIRHFRGSQDKRHDVNVRGTQRLLDHCVKYGVKQLVVVSSGYVYGAFPENPYMMDEDTPLSASRAYPEIRDLVEVDTVASAFLWRCPEVTTSVLRPVSVLGPHVRSMAGAILSMRRVPCVMGFDPMMQFIGEADLVEAIVLALEHQLRGVFNVVGPGEVPLRVAIRECGRVAWPVPEPILRASFERMFRWGVWPYPAGVLDFLKYPVSLSGKRFVRATGFQPKIELSEIFDAMVDD